jgi:hypothetical protein
MNRIAFYQHLAALYAADGRRIRFGWARGSALFADGNSARFARLAREAQGIWT